MQESLRQLQKLRMLRRQAGWRQGRRRGSPPPAANAAPPRLSHRLPQLAERRVERHGGKHLAAAGGQEGRRDRWEGGQRWCEAGREPTVAAASAACACPVRKGSLPAASRQPHTQSSPPLVHLTPGRLAMVMVTVVPAPAALPFFAPPRDTRATSSGHQRPRGACHMARARMSSCSGRAEGAQGEGRGPG